MSDNEELDKHHPNFVREELPTKSNFPELVDQKGVFASKDTLQIHMNLSQAKCQLNIQVVCASQYAKQCVQGSLILEVYSTISIEGVREQVVREGEKHGIRPRDMVYLFLKKH